MRQLLNGQWLGGLCGGSVRADVYGKQRAHRGFKFCSRREPGDAGGPVRILMADLNGDGKLDLIAANFGIRQHLRLSEHQYQRFFESRAHLRRRLCSQVLAVQLRLV